MQIRLPGTRSALPPLVEVGVKRRVAPSRPRRRRRPRGEPRWDPEPARVSSLSPRPEEDDGHWPSIRTWSNGPGRSVPLWPYRPLTSGPRLSGNLTLPSRVQWAVKAGIWWAGPAPLRSSPLTFFSWILFLFRRSVSMLLEIKSPKILWASILCDSSFWV
jgi:hypothetical protein